MRLGPSNSSSGSRSGTSTRVVLTLTRAASSAAAPVADALTRTAALRGALMSHTSSRPWRIPAADAALWVRACADAPSFWDLLRQAPGWDVVPPTCPTTVAWGDRDRLLIYSRQAPRARRMLPAAHHVTLAGCGHVPTWDDPDQVARVILEASR
jgi:pimeloyl-ACP methyl ester carboxylesterase